MRERTGASHCCCRSEIRPSAVVPTALSPPTIDHHALPSPPRPHRTLTRHRPPSTTPHNTTMAAPGTVTGTRIPPHAPSAMRLSLTRRASPTAGVTLSVLPNSGEEPAGRMLVLLKDQSNVLTIGRKSAAPGPDAQDAADGATFRCPVISRKHARIAFSESGNVSAFHSDVTWRCR